MYTQRYLWVFALITNKSEKVKFTCLRCGGCCSSGPNVTLTVSDVCRIARYLGVDWRKLTGEYMYVIIADYIPVVVLRGINSKCVFLKYVDNTPTCTIYPARPMRCQLYPFLPIALSENSRLEVSTKCPGVGRGELVEPPWSVLEKYFNEVKQHYKILYEYIFTSGLEPLKALENLLDKFCSQK